MKTRDINDIQWKQVDILVSIKQALQVLYHVANNFLFKFLSYPVSIAITNIFHS